MSERVLLVDDEDFVLRALRGHLAPLTEAGEIAVAVAVDGPDAVEKARAAAEAGNPFDLAIIDFQMTDEMDGLETLQHIRAHSHDLVAIMLTGHARQNTPVEALNLGFRHYLVKPATREAFLGAIQEQLRQIRLAKRNRQLQGALAKFHDAVTQILSVVQSAARIADPNTFEAASAAIVEAGIAAAGAGDGFLLLLPDEGDRFRVIDRKGATRADIVAHVGAGAAGMCLSGGGPTVSAGTGPLGAFGPDASDLERGHTSVVAVPMASDARRCGVLWLADPADPEACGDGRVPALALISRLGAMVLDAQVAQARSRQLLVGALQAGMAASPAADARLLDQLTATVRALDRSFENVPGSQATPEADDEAAVAMQIASTVRDIARYGPEGLEFCRSMLTQFRRLLRTYCE